MALRSLRDSLFESELTTKEKEFIYVWNEAPSLADVFDVLNITTEKEKEDVFRDVSRLRQQDNQLKKHKGEIPFHVIPPNTRAKGFKRIEKKEKDRSAHGVDPSTLPRKLPPPENWPDFPVPELRNNPVETHFAISAEWDLLISVRGDTELNPPFLKKHGNKNVGELPNSEYERFESLKQRVKSGQIDAKTLIERFMHGRTRNLEKAYGYLRDSAGKNVFVLVPSTTGDNPIVPVFAELLRTKFDKSASIVDGIAKKVSTSPDGVTRGTSKRSLESKVRNPDRYEIDDHEIPQGVVTIIDDSLSSGGTFAGFDDALREKKVEASHLAVLVSKGHKPQSAIKKGGKEETKAYNDFASALEAGLLKKGVVIELSKLKKAVLAALSDQSRDWYQMLRTSLQDQSDGPPYVMDIYDYVMYKAGMHEVRRFIQTVLRS